MSRAPVHPPRCSPGKTPPPHPHYGPHDLPLTLPHPLRNAIAFYQALLVSFRLVSLGSGADTRRRGDSGWRDLVLAAPCPRAVEVLDEAAKGVVRDELLVVQLEASRGRGAVGLEPLLDGAALVRMAVRLICDGQGI